MSQQRNPLPWRIEIEPCFHIRDAKGGVVLAYDVCREIDGTFLIRAVNSFDDLLAALKGLVAKIDQVEIDSRLGDETDRVFAHYEFDEARAAIARAEKGI